MNSLHAQAHIFIIGEVIGVGFRAWARHYAILKGLNGWIKNTHSREDIFGKAGGVECLLQGSKENIDSFISHIRQGPPTSRVDDVEIYWTEAKEVFSSFAVVHDRRVV